MAEYDSYELRVDGYNLHSTWPPDSKEEAEKVIASFQKRNEVLILRNFGVDMHTVNPKTRRVLTWGRVKGYSLWKP